MRDGWRNLKLGEIAVWKSGGTPPKSVPDYWDGNIPWISGKSLNVERISTSDRTITTLGAAEGSQLAPAGATLILVRGMSLLQEIRVGHCERELAFNQDVKALVPTDEVDPWFLTYALLGRRPELHAMVHTASHGTGVLGTEALQAMQIPAPDISEQKQISGILGGLDDLVDTNLRILGAIDAYATTAFLQAWDGTTRASLSELGTLTMGQSPPGDTYNEVGLGTPFHQGIRDFGVRFPSDRVYCTAPSRIADEGDILIAVRAPVGTTNVANKRTAMGRGVAGLKANHPAITLQALRVDPNTWSAHQGTGTVFSSINKAELLRLQVPYVDDAALEARLNTLDVAYGGLSTEVDGLRRTRDELLPLLMSGAVSPGEVTVAS